MRKKYLILLSIMGAIISFDQLTKHLIYTYLSLNSNIEVISGFFSLTHVRNSGAAFGLLADAPSAFRTPFFIVLPIVALVFLIFIFRKIEERQRLLTFSLACIAGGAIGNFIDRIRFNYVIDFVLFYVKDFYWPAFNIADTFICIGVFIFAYHAIFLDKKKKAEGN